VMLVISQHCNITHPKLLTLPYGLKLDSYFDKKAVWDSLNFVLKTNGKSALVYKGDNPSKSSKHAHAHVHLFIYLLRFGL
jgi:hypothetical protein